MTIRYLNDLEPDVEIVLTAATPVDLGDAVSVTVIGSVGGEQVFSRATTAFAMVGDSTVVTMPLEAADTATVRRIDIKVVVVWPETRPQTFPGAVLDVRRDAQGLRL